MHADMSSRSVACRLADGLGFGSAHVRAAWSTLLSGVSLWSGNAPVETLAARLQREDAVAMADSEARRTSLEAGIAAISAAPVPSEGERQASNEM